MKLWKEKELVQIIKLNMENDSMQWMKLYDKKRFNEPE